MDSKTHEETTFHMIPPERKAQIFEHLPYVDKINVSQVCREFAIVVQFSSNLTFNTTLNNENLKYVAERCCPLNILRVQNWTSIFRIDISLHALLSPVNELKLKDGISRYNLNQLLSTTGGSVNTLIFHRSFFDFRGKNDFPANPHAFKWNFVRILAFKIPGGENPNDSEHLKFLKKLFNSASLPVLSDFSIELGRKLGAETSRVNRNGRFFPETFVPLVIEIFNFIASHNTTLQYLKLYFILSVLPQQNSLFYARTIPTTNYLEENLSKLNLKKVQVRYYNNDYFDIPAVRHLVTGTTQLIHIEFEQSDSLYPEVYSAIERNANTLKTAILEVRMNEFSNPHDDVYWLLNSFKNCTSLETLHLRGLGMELMNLEGVPSTVSTLRIGYIIPEPFYNTDNGLQTFLHWITVNMSSLMYFEITDPENDIYSQIASLIAELYLFGRLKNLKSVHYMETNWFGDYAGPKIPKDVFVGFI